MVVSKAEERAHSETNGIESSAGSGTLVAHDVAIGELGNAVWD